MAAFSRIQCTRPPPGPRANMGRGAGRLPGFSLFNNDDQVQVIVAFNVGEGFTLPPAPVNMPVVPPVESDDGLAFFYGRINPDTSEACEAHIHTTSTPSPYVYLPTAIEIVGFRGLGPNVLLNDEQCDWFFRALSRVYSSARSVSVTLAIPDPIRPSEFVSSAVVLAGPVNVSVSKIHVHDGFAYLSTDWDAPFSGGTVLYGLDGYTMQAAAIARDPAHHTQFLEQNVFAGMEIALSAQADVGGGNIASFPLDEFATFSFRVTGDVETDETTAIADVIASAVDLYIETRLNVDGLQAAAAAGSGAVIDLFANTGDGDWDHDPDATPPHIASVFAQGQEGQIGSFFLAPTSITTGVNRTRYVLDDADVVANIVHRTRALRSLERIIRPLENPGESRVYVTDFSSKLGQDGRRKIAASKESVLMSLVTTLEDFYSCDLGRLRAILKERILPAFVEAAIETEIFRMASCRNSIYREVGSSNPIAFEQETVVDTWNSLLGTESAEIDTEPSIPDPPQSSVIDQATLQALLSPPSPIPGTSGQDPLGAGSPVVSSPLVGTVLNFVADDEAEEAAQQFERTLNGQELMDEMAGSMLAFSSRARPPPVVSDRTRDLGVGSFVRIDIEGPYVDGTQRLNESVVSLPAYAPAVYSGLSELYLHKHVETVSFSAGQARMTDGSVYGCIESSVAADAGTPLLSARLSAAKTDVAALAVFARTVRSLQTQEQASSSTGVFLSLGHGPRGFMAYPGLTNTPNPKGPMFGCEVPQFVGFRDPVTGGIAAHKTADEYYLLSDNPYDAVVDTVVASQMSTPFEPMDAPPLSVARMELACSIADLGKDAATLPTSGFDRVTVYPYANPDRANPDDGPAPSLDVKLSLDPITGKKAASILESFGFELTPRAKRMLPSLSRIGGLRDSGGNFVFEVNYDEQSALEVVLTYLIAVQSGQTMVQFPPDSWLGRVYILTQASRKFNNVGDMQAVFGSLGQQMVSGLLSPAVLYIASELVAWMNHAAEPRVTIGATSGDVFSTFRQSSILDEQSVNVPLRVATTDVFAAFGRSSFSGTLSDVVSQMKKRTSTASSAATRNFTFKSGSGPVPMTIVGGPSYAESSTTHPLFTPPGLYNVLVQRIQTCQDTALAGTMTWLVENTTFARGIARPDVYSVPWRRGSVVAGPAQAVFDDLWESILVERAAMVAESILEDGTAGAADDILRAAPRRVARIAVLALAYAALQNVFLDIDVRQTTSRRRRHQMGAWIASLPVWYDQTENLDTRVVTTLRKNRDAMKNYYLSLDEPWRSRAGTFNGLLALADIPGLAPSEAAFAVVTDTMRAIAQSTVAENAAFQR